MSDNAEKQIKRADTEEYVRNAVQLFLCDPPDSEFQRGFLTALLVVAKEALGTDERPYSKTGALPTRKHRTVKGVAS